jgi:predicted DNA-binding transcriptional regulator AlpA
VKLKDHLPLKRVLSELGVSRTTLWRAMNSNISGFPAPTVVRRHVYWPKSDLLALEEAVLRYRGRCVFEDDRAKKGKVAALEKVRAAAAGRRRGRGVAKDVHPDLFALQRHDE